MSGGEIDLIAPSTGTYKGISIYQDRRASSSGSSTNIINGNQPELPGGLLLPQPGVPVRRKYRMSTQCVQMVARRVTFTGTSAISNTCPPGSGASSLQVKR